MFPVSAECLAALKAQTVHTRVYGTVGGVKFDGKNLLGGSFRISADICGGDAVEIGTANISQFNATFTGLNISRYAWKGAEIRVFVGVVLGPLNVEWIPMGVYDVAEADNTNSGVAVTAYDRLARLNRAAYHHIGKSTPWTLMQTAAGRCNVNFAQTMQQIRAMPNGSALLYEPEDSDIKTHLDRMRYVAGVLGAVLVADREGNLVFKRYGRRIVDRIPPRLRGADCAFADYVTQYTAVSVRDADGNAVTYRAQEDDALLYDLTSNPYFSVDTADVREQKARTVLSALQAVRYVPFSCTGAYLPCYDLGDVIQFYDGIADGLKLYCITASDFTYSGAWRMEGAGADPEIARAKNAAERAAEAARDSFSDGGDFLSVRNPEAVTVDDYETETVLSASFAAKDGAHILAQAQIEMETSITAEAPALDLAQATAYYQADGTLQQDDSPPAYLYEGKNVLNLLYDYYTRGAGNHTFDVLLTMEGGAAAIPARRALLILSGNGNQGIDEPIEEWEEPEERFLVYIEITSPPTKTEYKKDERINYAGMVVTAFYSDDTSADITADCKITPKDGGKLEEPGWVQVAAEYTDPESEETYYAYTDLTVDAEPEPEPEPYIIAIYVASGPIYGHAPGTFLDYAGVVIMATRSDGADFDVTDECTYTPADGTVWEDGRAEVAVSLEDNGETYTTDFIVEEIGIAEEVDPAIDPAIDPGPADPDDPTATGPFWDNTTIAIDEETGGYTLKNPYVFTGVEQEIDSGKCAVVEIDNSEFLRIESIEIT